MKTLMGTLMLVATFYVVAIALEKNDNEKITLGEKTCHSN
jgi:hypothetical protein